MLGGTDETAKAIKLLRINGIIGINEDVEEEVDEVMARNKKLDVHLQTNHFEIDAEKKEFTASLEFIMTVATSFPWSSVTQNDIDLKEDSNVPRIRLTSSDSGKVASFYLVERDLKTNYYKFMVSKGSLMNKKTGIPEIRGWSIIFK